MCKNILVPRVWKDKPAGRCSCGFIRTLGISIESESFGEIKAIGGGVIGNNTSEGFDFLCKKCGHNLASARDLGEILGNEKSVTLFTCLKCGNVERR